MDDEPPDTPLETTRPPTDEDLAALAARLNELGAKYIVVGGYAIIQAGMVRNTMDIDLLVDCSPENDALVRKALESLPDQAVLELESGEIERYQVVRVCDEFTVDLIVRLDYHGVTIPFASPALLWKTKQTCREKDAWDREFLKKLLIDRGEWPVD